jgi:DNA-binding MarR family transcriptional regulator
MESTLKELQVPEYGPLLVDFLRKCHHLERRLASASGIPLDELYCLALLHRHSPPSVKALSRLLGVHITRTSKLLNALEARGYILRTLDPGDRRRELITLSPAGLRMVQVVYTVSARTWERAFPAGKEEVLRAVGGLVEDMSVPV